ncbi:Hypothetical protein CINCED_3A022331 [Cinara cedri]|uniref:Uncharacterized protein n=1 Tax=Cinara cedri TaxID=506608 RepID=A0A5E4MCS8_9HEMI|nr:Hypothetical protein CINCED_3A022331 [Cinara cedri]
MEYYSSIVSPKQINLENIPSVHTLDDMTVSNDANLDKIESCKMFKKFPQVEPVQRTIKKT